MINKEELLKLINEVVSEELGKTEQSKPQTITNSDGLVRKVDASGIIFTNFNNFKLDKFDTGKESDQVYLKDVYSLEESPRLGFGVMEMIESKFKWTLKYDEIDYVLDGELEILIDGRSVRAKKGETILIPKNTTIYFSAPKYAKFTYTVFPANWQTL